MFSAGAHARFTSSLAACTTSGSRTTSALAYSLMPESCGRSSPSAAETMIAAKMTAIVKRARFRI
jgi:hypothetical protein